MTHISIERCPQCNAQIVVGTVRCAICKRAVGIGDFTLAPARSIHAGRPVCAACIDMVPIGTERRFGPTETKGGE